jgi:hypothetical protein
MVILCRFGPVPPHSRSLVKPPSLGSKKGVDYIQVDLNYRRRATDYGLTTMKFLLFTALAIGLLVADWPDHFRRNASVADGMRPGSTKELTDRHKIEMTDSEIALGGNEHSPACLKNS